MSDAAARWQARAARDLRVALSVVAAGGLLFVTTDSVEHLLPMLVRWEKAQVDDLLLTLWLAVAVAGWFALRRWRDCIAQVSELRASARERDAHLARVEELSAHVLQAEEHERNRLAELLHDEVGQTLYACQLELHLLGQRVHDAQATQMLRHVETLAQRALTHARELSRELSPPELQDLGLQDAILALLPRLQQRYALRMRLLAGDGWQVIPARCHGPVFHSIKELLLNIAKHAGASEVSMDARRVADGQVRVSVTDDGSGFDVTDTPRGFGLYSVERRMACLDGRLEISSALGRGTTATLHLHAG